MGVGKAHGYKVPDWGLHKRRGLDNLGWTELELLLGDLFHRKEELGNKGGAVILSGKLTEKAPG